MQFYLESIDSLAAPSPAQQQPIISLVETILEKKRNGEPPEQEEREIEPLVYRLSLRDIIKEDNGICCVAEPETEYA